MRGIIVIFLTGLFGFETGCTKTPSPVSAAPAVQEDQILRLVRAWVIGSSPETTLELLNTARDKSIDTLTARVRLTNFMYRDPLDVRQAKYSGDAAAQFKWGNGKWAMTRFSVGAGTPAFRAWDGLHITDDYASADGGSEHLKTGDIAANESIAISNVRRLVTAEIGYVSRNHNTCGTMRNLIRDGFIEEKYAAGDVSGYRISIQDVGSGCSVLAVPRSFGITGLRSFYAPIADGFIRYSSDGSFPTDAHPRLR